MKPTNLSFGDLLYQRQPFVIPKYQRTYAWDQEEIDQFIKDLFACYQMRRKGDIRKHFFGGIVSIHHLVAGTGTGYKYEVVDGQQRLATFVLLLSLLADAYEHLATQAKQEGETDLEEIAKLHTKRIREQFLQYPDVVDGKPVTLWRLVLSKADEDYFKALLEGRLAKHERPSHRRLRDAQKKLKQELVETCLKDASNLKEKIDTLEHITKVATDDCEVIHLVSESPQEAYRLFQVLNNRGLTLTEGDLLRARTLEFLDAYHSPQALAEEAWDSILAKDVDEVEHFLRSFFSSHHGERPGKRTLFEDFMNGFFPESPTSEAAAKSMLNIIISLREESEYYQRLAEPEWPYDPSTHPITAWDRQRLNLLIDSLKHTLCFPLLLAALKLKEKQFSEIVQLVELFAFRYVVICRRHAGKLDKVYLTEAKKIRKDPTLYKISSLRAELRKLQIEEANNDSFKAALPDVMRYKEKSSNKVLKYFLTTLDYYLRWYNTGAPGEPLCLDKTVIFDFEEVQIEHIYPRNPLLPVPDLDMHKNRLGNLTFWGPDDNKEVSNREFPIKKPVYAASAVGLNREIAEYEKWGIEELEAREAKLVKIATAVFSV